MFYYINLKNPQMRGRKSSKMEKLKIYFYSLPLIKNINFWVETQQQNINISLQSKLKKHITIIEIFTGYSFDTIVNAFTVSSLVQVSIKLFFSLFFIKLNIFLQLCLLFLLLPIYLKFNTFDYIRNNLGIFMYYNIPESVYEKPFDLDEFDGDFPEDAIVNYNDKWYNHVLLFFVHFFIGFRLFILQEPYLSLILKFIAMRYFLLNEYLLIAYTISFIFILSRFVFLLSDIKFATWQLSLSQLFEKDKTPKITKTNIKIMTHWSLRGVSNWISYRYHQKNNANIFFEQIQNEQKIFFNPEQIFNNI